MFGLVELRVGATVSFPNETFERVNAIEGRLYDQHKIRFDTGFGDGAREWELDWSLQHPDSMTRQEAMETITKELKSEGLHYKYTIRTYEDSED